MHATEHVNLTPSTSFQYTAPTAIRLLRKLGAQHLKGYDLSSLRTLGSVGEPIAADAWEVSAFKP